jgi:putative heme iron utilization protein
MPIAIKKCKFYIEETKFYKFIIRLRELSINLKKIKAVVNWQELISVI